MPEKSWTLRKATVDDAEALTKCMHAAYGIYALQLKGVFLPPMTANYEDEIRDFPVWIAEANDRLVGGLVLMPEEDCMSIANIAVHPEFQGKGLGRGLLALAEAEAGKQDYHEMRLTTHVALTENVLFYTRLGWSEIDRDETRIYMRKSLK